MSRLPLASEPATNARLVKSSTSALTRSASSTVDVEGPAQQLEWLRVRHPLGRFGRPEAVAAAILFLASDEASLITGANLAVDWGYAAQ